MAKLSEITFCPVAVVPKSKLMHTSTVKHSLVPKLRRYSGKNLALRAKKQSLWVKGRKAKGNRTCVFVLTYSLARLVVSSCPIGGTRQSH